MSRNELLYKALVFLLNLTLMVPVGLGLVNWSRLSASFRVLVTGLGTYLVILLLITYNPSELFGWKLGHASTYILSLLWGVTFTTLYALELPRDRKWWIVLLLGGLAGVYVLVDMLILSGIHSLEGYSVPIMTFALIVSTLIFVYYLVRYSSENTLLAVPLFWVAGAKLISGLTNGLLDLAEPQVLMYSVRLLMYLYIFAYLSTSICHILYAVGIWKERQHHFKSFGLVS